MKGKKKRGKRLGYGIAGIVLAAGLLGSSGISVSASGRDGEEMLTAGVAQILDVLAEEDSREIKKETVREEQLQNGTAGEAEEKGDPAEVSGTEGEKKEQAGQADESSETEEAEGILLQDELVMADVEDVLNVRSEPSEEAEKVGYLYADCGGTILEKRDGWTKLESGSLIGWAKDEYLLFGKEAVEELADVGRLVAHVTGETLRIRKEPSTEAEVYDLAAQGETYEVVNKAQLRYSDGIELASEWAAVDYEGETGYVSSDYIEVNYEFDHGETLEEIAARQQAPERTGESGSGKVQASPGRQNSGGIPAGTSDATLLAALIQCEAGSESYEGQLAVGAVVVNRVKSSSYPNTISDVIFASGQFTPAGSGKLARVVSGGNISSSCVQAANEALSGVTNVGSATHFRRAGGREGIVIGNHVFW